MDYSAIKLIIWDLDETFWNGVLSDENIEIIDSNIELVKKCIDAGVMCSICSKNDENKAIAKLKEIGIYSLFVFCSINWTAKGVRVSEIIKEIQLRPENVLFIDDNALNRNEVLSCSPGIHVADVDVLDDLQQYFNEVEKKDIEHKRLKQYKVLENKKAFKASLGSNEEFLIKSNIRVDIKKDCLEHIQRIHELILRSNQLNFTKVRSSEEELLDLLRDSDNQCGYVEVKDNFGDYGIVGFYAIKANKLLHYVFSCRTLGMGIEQYVYQQIGKPLLNVIGEVVSDVTTPKVTWITQVTENSQGHKDKLNNGIIISKGPCDMSQLFAYIHESSNIITEFTYVSNQGVLMEARNHTTQILNCLKLSSSDKHRLCNILPFCDDLFFKTRLFDDDISFAIISVFSEANLGVYREKSTGIMIPFGEYVNDLTDEANWDDIINQRCFTANYNFKNDELKFIKENFEFIGRLSPEQTVKNCEDILSHLSTNTVLILNLGSETPFYNNTQKAYEDRHECNAKLNKLLRNWALCEPRLKLLDVNNFIDGQASFTNNINHFQRNIYYKMAKKVVEIIEETGGQIRNHSFYGSLMKNFLRKLKQHLLKMTQKTDNNRRSSQK